MNANRTIAVLCALCALGALPTHARVFDVRHVGEDSSSTASLSTSPTGPSTAATAGTTDGTTTNAPTTYNPNHPYCLTCVGTERTNDRYQLIRGDDEVKQCYDHNYCDCKEHKQMECGGVFSPFLLFNPDKQECTMGFSCTDYLKKHPAPPAPTPTTPTSGSTTEQSTTTSPPASNPTTNAPTTYNPNHPYCLTCVGTERTNDRYQLIRGDDEVKQCNDHNYCDCKEHKQMECGGVFRPFLLFNPDEQKCTMEFSCADYLRKHPAPPAPTPTTPTSGSTTEQSTTRSPTTKNPPTQSTASKAPNPSTTPGTTAKPSSAWANRATALTVVCLAAVAAL